MKFTTALATLAFAAASSLVNAAPANEARDVWDPKVLFPTTGSVLQSGQAYTVTWDLSQKPAEITNPIGTITLNFGNFGSPLILARGFELTDGQAEITIPEVYTESDYSITLWGDSGNWSGQFEIQGVN
ncbi:uncharacterized protein PHACADRAFT_255233 [Phanerochaete carnosa HHB-10118-sp]|uniref:Uncharacterized protein n=1 Tax=Phanerochaete carnosa (strain HHB-10118-sp) TaxID=650164 RepID=K5W742_PHACS|nr:uncharacterized protein PHACADRAFT_255233 [Phanerochaete carnosa HHB-10118-sp]EKM54975.1 hypothetical protein PHACADRAFT_255233 [Phanerochaete carnosa HHB-10118-sp]